VSDAPSTEVPAKSPAQRWVPRAALAIALTPWLLTAPLVVIGHVDRADIHCWPRVAAFAQAVVPQLLFVVIAAAALGLLAVAVSPGTLDERLRSLGSVALGVVLLFVVAITAVDDWSGPVINFMGGHTDFCDCMPEAPGPTHPHPSHEPVGY
jgi:hypothetical protein